jgi:hypothetical protein
VDDAKTLELAFVETHQPQLKSRYAYYCGQSYYDCKDHHNAVVWFKKCVELNTWNQESYCACMCIGDIYSFYKTTEETIFWWCKSAQYDPERIEGIVLCMRQFYMNKNYTLVNALYLKWKDYKHDLTNRLFYRPALYDYEMEWVNSISAYHVKDFESGYECCKKIVFHCKQPDKVENVLKNVKILYKDLYDKDEKFKAHVEEIKR